MGAQRITRHGGAKYKVMGVNSDLWETLTHIRYTCEHVHFFHPIVRDDANHVIFRDPPLYRTATPSRVRHSPVRIAPSTQRDSLQASPSGPAVAHTARRKMASKPPRQPPRGESRKSPLRCVNKADQAALGHSMEHGSGLHHAKVKEPLPLAALHLQPPRAAGSQKTCVGTA